MHITQYAALRQTNRHETHGLGNFALVSFFLVQALVHMPENDTRIRNQTDWLHKTHFILQCREVKCIF